PFAGANYYSYRELQKYAAPYLEVISVELPGRGKRFPEPLLTDIHQMVKDVWRQLAGQIVGPYAIFGHSMGACLGYLMVKKIIKEGLPKPRHLFFSGRSGPSVRTEARDRHLLPRQEFFELLRQFAGTPREVLADRDMMNLFEPMLRADFQANDNYLYEETEPFDIPITVMIGLNEPTSYAEALTWQKETTAPISVRQFVGGHFFVFDYLPEISKIFYQTLQPVTWAEPARATSLSWA
ncbi:MAG: thioesterase, partial [Deltaproteobacteria bacterium]|nr:thioesterase [Deltaproteobacteria bacterium]